MSKLLSQEEMDSHLSQSERKKCKDTQHILLDVLFKEFLLEKNLFVFSMFSYFWVPWTYEKPTGGRAPCGWQMPNPRVAPKFANAPPREWQSAKTASIRLGR